LLDGNYFRCVEYDKSNHWFFLLKTSLWAPTT
jgi:hypothetical protein